MSNVFLVFAGLVFICNSKGVIVDEGLYFMAV